MTDFFQALQPLLRTRFIGRTGESFAELDSTNRELITRLETGLELPEGYCLTADTQTQGQGRQGRVWHSPAGQNLYFSFLLHPSTAPETVVTLPLVAGLAVAMMLEEHGLQPQVKWPNDIWLDGKKVCGILCEMRLINDRPMVVIGIGININQTEFPAELQDIATSLALVTHTQANRAKCLAETLSAFEPLYQRWQAEGFAALVSDFTQRDALYGKSITVNQGGKLYSGMADGVNPDGTLRLLLSDGTCLAIDSGEAHLLRTQK